MIFLSLLFSFQVQASNKFLFYGIGYPIIKKNECGQCKPICHLDKNDRGGFTCIGVSVKSNSKFYAKLLNDFYNNCKISAASILQCGNNFDFDSMFKHFYYKNYYKKYENCDIKVGLVLVDMAILTGPKGAALIFQRAYGLKDDGIFGPESLKLCRKKLDISKMTQERIKRHKLLKTYKLHGVGWERRARNTEKYIRYGFR